MDQTLAFIGGGNMARSLIGGLLARGHRPQHITVADPVASQLDALHASHGVRVTQDNAQAAQDADVLVLAVKPQEMRAAAAAVRGAVRQRHPLVISIAAGIRTTDLRRWIGGGPLVRCMPNRPALQGCGITGLYATADVSAEDRALAEQILNAVGTTLWLPREADLDAVTAISGSGPAYFFLLIEMLEQAGIALGLAAEVSRTLAVETAFGAGLMAHHASESPATLREQVTSRGGTTEAALAHLDEHRVREIFAAAVAAAAARSAQLANDFGKE